MKFNATLARAACQFALVCVAVVYCVPTSAEALRRNYSVSSDNFVVNAPSEELARQVLKNAEKLRRELALQWYGKTIPDGQEVVIVRAKTSQAIDSGHTWPPTKSSPKKLHLMWLTGTREHVVGSVLAHEMTHVILSRRFPQGMPIWANEAAACLQDGEERITRRWRMIGRFAKSRQWPSIKPVMEAKSIAATDRLSYAVAATLGRYLLQRADRPTFLQFVEDGKKVGWDGSLRKHYGIRDRDHLQQLWQRFCKRQLTRRQSETESAGQSATKS